MDDEPPCAEPPVGVVFDGDVEDELPDEAAGPVGMGEIFGVPTPTLLMDIDRMLPE